MCIVNEAWGYFKWLGGFIANHPQKVHAYSICNNCIVSNILNDILSRK